MLEDAIRKSECQKQIYNQKICDLENMLKTTASQREEEQKILMGKLCDEKNENVKNKATITQLNETIRQRALNEKLLKQCVDKYEEDNKSLKVENEELKNELNMRNNLLDSVQNNGSVNVSEFEEFICQLKMQKADIKSRCCNLKAELNREIKMKKMLESRVDDLNLMLESKLEEVIVLLSLIKNDFFLATRV